ncbi:MAG: DNA mismatch repair endonuclease MutL [Gemmatimonadetes bacterium]|nr:DNA mismatch repair endonuclease MutL [Gemmatimonadota bacterium]
MTALRIAVLPSAVADQIAAGEVVERPASVVKELLENALDAGARVIDVTIGEGGRALVRVADDGHGMERADATLAVERHATSKIRAASDLVGVASFGFRGEALPSIGSVSRMEIETATSDGEATRVRVVGGKRELVDTVARRRGTTVTVESLFFNTPARHKFMKGVRSEWRAIQDTLTSAALARRDVRLSATHNGREVMALAPATSLRDRVSAIWGAAADSMVDVDDVSGPFRVSGLVERPADVGLASRRVFLSVNGRAVRDGGIVRAAEAAYRSTIPSGVRPTILLELTVPVQDVDVNVHPAKAEVRFRDRWTVERAVERAVRHALGTGAGETFAFTTRGAVSSAAPHIDIEALRGGTADSPPLFRAEPGAETHGAGSNDDSPRGGAPATAPTAGFGASDDVGASAVRSSSAAPEAAASDVVVPRLIQLRRTWMMFESGDAIVLIDQHSAHERVLFERFMLGMAGGNVASQALLFPLTLHLSPSEFEAFDAHRDLFTRLGFEAEPFGGLAIAVHAVPSPHARFDAERCLRETLATLAGDRSASTLARHERLAATVACKGAVKAGDVLATDEMRALYVALARTTLPAHDVHGRSTIVQLTWDELERRFGRR